MPIFRMCKEIIAKTAVNTFQSSEYSTSANGEEYKMYKSAVYAHVNGDMQ